MSSGKWRPFCLIPNGLNTIMLYCEASLTSHEVVGPANVPQVTLALMGHKPDMDTTGCVIGSAQQR